MTKKIGVIGIIIIVILAVYGLSRLGSSPAATPENPVVEAPASPSKTASTPVTNTATTPTSGQVFPITAQPLQVAVAIKDFKFVPQKITIKKNQSIVWTNYDSAPHTVTSDEGDLLKSPRLAGRQTYSATFTTPGTYLYHCTVHPSMTATVVVEN